MNRTKCFFLAIIILSLTVSVYPWSGVTHRGISTQVEWPYEGYEGTVHKYLKNIGYEEGRNTPLELTHGSGYYVPIEIRDVDRHLDDYEHPALEWFLKGSKLEDGRYITILGIEVPTSLRAKNHFHDPTMGNRVLG